MKCDYCQCSTNSAATVCIDCEARHPHTATHNEIRAAFAVIANNTKEAHIRQFALNQFRAMKEPA